jgi:hypothetical protein
MCRAIAITLLALFGWTPVAPLFAANSEANLPPCCRRHGKHRCAMQRLLASCGKPGGPPAFDERCPYAGKSDAPAQMRLPRPEAGSAVAAAIVVEAAAAVEIPARRESYFFDSNPLRGPPALVA